MGSDGQNWYLGLSYDQWVPLSVAGPTPAARYKHAAVTVDGKLYIIGGSRNGRYLSDIQVFDLKSLTWSTIKLKSGVLPATSGHNMILWENKLLFLAGHSKDVSDTVTVRFIDLQSYECGVIETFGKLPVARGGQSVTLVGSKLIMFGGEDQHRRLLNDISVLDLETMTWSTVETMQTSPAPRFDHTAALHADRYLLILGGCSHSIFFNDLHVLDLETMEWSQPQLQGDLVSPRAGHAGVTIGDNWYIVGGGDNKSGVPETLMLNMSKLVVSVLATVKGRDPLASEGLSVSSASLDGENFLVAFGGYNGKYNNEVYVMRPKPRDVLHPKILQSPAAEAAAASVRAAYALIKPEKYLSEREDSSFKEVHVDNTQQSLLAEISALGEQKKALESSLADIRAENADLRNKIEDVNTTHADLSKELQSVQGQLISERSRCAKLEAQIAELQKTLESMQSIEEEVQALRKEKSKLDRDMDASSVQKQGSGGAWKWITG
ncbi:acyl-CoA-binding domain-containing protein 4 [Solanum lycopersicum]|uniref:acyl-CoA-binding domain-containing protein 4 n=1 Tax=Solanum lycopersicum TaxID=4081 RepID=UPI003748BE05